MSTEEQPLPANDLQFRLTSNSIYPFMVDLGLVMLLFGIFLVGTLVAVLGALVLLVGITGWFREARAEYRELPDQE